MAFKVYLTADATHDLEQLYEYVATQDSPEKANVVLARIEKTVMGLADSPLRGPYPKELLAVGLREYREIFFKPYRIIYRVIGERVYVMLIADGRRNMQMLLQQRLLAKD